jgi:hypothetical protein
MSFCTKLLVAICLIAFPGAPQEKLEDALFRAIQSEDVAALRALIAKGAKVNTKDAQGNTPLHAAAENWAIDCIEVLLSKGADVNARNAEGKTPFMVAANVPQALELLLDAGADSNAKDNHGRTALMLASESGEISKVKSLIQHGIDIASASPEGKTALDIAIQTKHQKVAALIRGETPSEFNCSKLEIKPKVIDAMLVDGQKPELAIKIESSYEITAGNSDDTFTGKLTLSLSDEARANIAQWAKKDLAGVAANLEVENVIAGFTRNPKCPDLELEFSPRSVSDKSFLSGATINLGRFRLGVRLDDGDLSKVICIWARMISSGRGRSGHIGLFNRVLNCAEYDWLN